MTFLIETVRLGLHNLRLHILRSILTALGIILGVTAVITMVSIGEGSKQAALEQIERLGAKNIIIRSVKPPEANQQSGGESRSWQITYGLTRGDLDAIEELFTDAETIVPVKDVAGQVLRQDKRMTSQAFGTTPQFQDVAGFRIERGRYLTDADMELNTDVAVLGSEVVKQLFPFDDPINQTIRLDDKVFTVVGVLSPVGLSGGAGAALVGRDLNHDVHIPLTTAKSRFGDLISRGGSGSFQNENVQLREIYYVSASRDRVILDSQLLKRLMELRHPDLSGVQMIIPYELLEEARRAALTWQVVLAAIAGISLLVGGIGIMNIMLATVTERTREIGIRRALGATQRHIIWQFLVETGVLSALGGVAGVLLGIGLSIGVGWGAERFIADATVSTQLTGWSIALSFSVATATGLVFGIYPAVRAAAQDPITALRHD